MATQSAHQNFRAAATGKLWNLIEKNAVEAAGFAGFAFWLLAVGHQTALLSMSALPTWVNSKALPIGLATSLFTAIAAAVCFYFLIALRNPAAFQKVLVDRSTRVLFSIASWTVIAYVGVAVAHITGSITGNILLPLIFSALMMVGATWVWMTLMRESLARAEAVPTA